MKIEQVKTVLSKFDNGLLKGEQAHQLAFPAFRRSLYSNAKPTTKTKSSAVMLLLFGIEEEIHFCLIKRPRYNGHHSGQVSFPGGQHEPSDKDLQETAIRETYEEVGVSLLESDIVGQLSTIFIPVSDFKVTPYVAVTSKPLTFSPSSNEVAYIINANLKQFMQANLKEVEVETPTATVFAPAFLINGEKVWGATAMILAEFQQLMLDLLAK